ncbi:hypothetical protein P9112_010245 [Eukaryota sp. TZLM1-RC]
MLKSHLFSSANLGGIGFTKSSILCQSAFLGGGKNFIYEFSRRFPDDSHLLVPNCSPYLYELSYELEKLPPQIWTKCFPQSIQEIPNRSLFNLQFCCKKFQQKLSKIFESLDFDVRLGLAKKKNPAFANLLQDMCDSTSSALVTTIPQVYGTLLSDSAWTLNMRFRSFIWPDNLIYLISDVQLGGVGFNSSKYLTKAAFIGGGKNFVFEFSRRYPFAENLLETTNSLFLDNLREEISSLSPDLWQSCFPISIQEIPDRSLYSLKFALKKLQRHLLKKFERKDFIVRLSTAKKENPAFANFLIDLKDSSSAVLINQIPQIYGLFLNDDQWTTAMRMRCYLWPCNLPNDLFCKCGAGLTLSHLFNCNRFISYRSTLHDAVRDQIHAMCNSYHIESFVEPLLRSLDINESVRDSEYGKRRADVVVPSGCLQEKCLEKCSIRSIPLDDSELYKRKKYANPLKELKHVRHVDYQICPFAISLYGRLGKTAMNFIDDFENLVKRRMNKRFDRRLWLNRIVFTIFKTIPKMISKALMSVSAHYEEIAVVRFDGVEACFEDIDF